MSATREGIQTIKPDENEFLGVTRALVFVESQQGMSRETTTEKSFLFWVTRRTPATHSNGRETHGGNGWQTQQRVVCRGW